MKIAVPAANGQICMHFGHCQEFYILTIDSSNNIELVEKKVPPPHEPGVLPRWLAEQKANIILAGGMGQRAQSLFTENNIQVVTGVQPGLTPEEVVKSYLADKLVTGENACDH